MKHNDDRELTTKKKVPGGDGFTDPIGAGAGGGNANSEAGWEDAVRSIGLGRVKRVSR